MVGYRAMQNAQKGQGLSNWGDRSASMVPSWRDSMARGEPHRPSASRMRSPVRESRERRNSRDGDRDRDRRDRVVPPIKAGEAWGCIKAGKAWGCIKAGEACGCKLVGFWLGLVENYRARLF